MKENKMIEARIFYWIRETNPKKTIMQVKDVVSNSIEELEKCAKKLYDHGYCDKTDIECTPKCSVAVVVKGYTFNGGLDYFIIEG